MKRNYQDFRLDLGCGPISQPGFIGVDRFTHPNVDVIADLDAPLPFASNSVDLVFASHSLEHVKDLSITIQEIFRVCKHLAQVCIVAPYYQQGLNLANPYHKQVFNEHTPRFWTNSEYTTVQFEEFDHPHASRWGLSESDNSKPEIDLRCLKIAFTYFPEYLGKPITELREARKKYLDVCDQIIYHLVAIKQPVSEGKMEEIVKEFDYYQSPYIEDRMLRDENLILQKEIAELHQQIDELKSKTHEEIELIKSDSAKELAAIKVQSWDDKEAIKIQYANELEALEAKTRAEIDAVKTQGEKELDAIKAQARADMEEDRVSSRNTIAALQKETEANIDKMKAQVSQLQMTNNALNSEFAGWKLKALLVSEELEKFRDRKMVRLFNCLVHNPNWDTQVPTIYQQFMDDIHIFQGKLDGYYLSPSINLQSVPFIFYPLHIQHGNLNGIYLAMMLNLPGSQGITGVEIVSYDNRIMTRSELPISSIRENQPVLFNFSPLSLLDENIWLRVYAKNADTPIRVFELRKNGLPGFRLTATRAFCGLSFSG